jgi:hypothetical protein
MVAEVASVGDDAKRYTRRVNRGEDLDGLAPKGIHAGIVCDCRGLVRGQDGGVVKRRSAGSGLPTRFPTKSSAASPVNRPWVAQGTWSHQG